MNETLLSELYNYVNKQKSHEYGSEDTSDTLEIAKREIEKLNIDYEIKLYRERERLLLYDRGDFVMEYKRSFFPNNGKIAFDITNDKFISEQFLKYAGIETTHSELYEEKEFTEAYAYAISKNENMVMKPLNMNSGTGVFLNVNKNNFKVFWEDCFEIQKRKKVEKPKVIIQNQIKGFEIRVVIRDDEIYSAIIRLPSHVIGDGIHTVEQLIRKKNQQRKLNPYFKSRLIKINPGLERLLQLKGRSLKDVLESEEFCILYPQSNVSSGGENFEVTKLLHTNILKLARNATLAIPGLHTSGVDIVIDGFDAEVGTVIEINKAPSFLMLYYPKAGEATRPLYDIFKTLKVEDRFMKDKLSFENLTEEDFEIIKSRFKYLYEKDKILQKAFQKMMN